MPIDIERFIDNEQASLASLKCLTEKELDTQSYAECLSLFQQLSHRAHDQGLAELATACQDFYETLLNARFNYLKSPGLYHNDFSQAVFELVNFYALAGSQEHYDLLKIMRKALEPLALLAEVDELVESKHSAAASGEGLKWGLFAADEASPHHSTLEDAPALATNESLSHWGMEPEPFVSPLSSDSISHDAPTPLVLSPEQRTSEPKGASPLRKKPKRKRDDVTAQVAAGPDARGLDHHYLVCLLGSQQYALPIQNVREILETRPVKSLPYPKHGIIGLVTVRGLTCPVIDVSPKLFAKTDHLSAQAAFKTSMIVCEVAERTFCFCVDTVKQVAALDQLDHNLQLLPQDSTQRKAITHIGRFAEQSILLVNMEEVVPA